jgi:glutathione synthase/RimK-type ligase-like ATP-grasp enzyme
VGEGEDRAIYTSRVDATHLKQADLLKACPALFQEEIDKRLDIRICVVETCIHAVGLSRRVGMNQALDIRRDNMSDVVHGEISLPSQIKSHVLSLTRSYGLRFAAIDMAIDSDGNWVFFEVNPNGQWAWMDLLGVTNIAESFVRAFSAESPRCA